MLGPLKGDSSKFFDLTPISKVLRKNKKVNTQSDEKDMDEDEKDDDVNEMADKNGEKELDNDANPKKDSSQL